MKPIERTILDYLLDYAREKPDEIILFDEKAGYKTKDLYRYAMNLGSFLLKNGVKPGDFIGLSGNRSKEAIAIYLALLAIGAVAVLCDPRENVYDFIEAFGVPIKLDHAISLQDEKWYFHGRLIPRMKELEDDFEFRPMLKPCEVSTIIFTSGSTGKAKGVMLSQYNLVNHLRNLYPVTGFGESDSALQLLPIFHAFGIAQIHDGIMHRCPLFFPKELTPDYLCACIEKYRFTRIGVVPSFAMAMVKCVQEKGYDTSSLSIVIIGGAPSTKEQLMLIQDTLQTTVLPSYGMSECVGITQAGPFESEEDRATSVGKTLPMNEIEISPEGEITVKGPALFLGYVGEEPFDRTQFFHTGDLGYFDERGFLHITGRLKDIIIRNGNNISSRYLEGMLLSLPFTEEAAVVGLPDEKVGEVPGALIVLKAGAVYDEAKLYSIFNNLERPEVVKIVEAMPMTSSGKPDKQRIKEILTNERKCG